MVDEIEGEVRTLSALEPYQPGQAIVSRNENEGPTHMIADATRIATALRDIVERQKLYTIISGKKFPQVEAWMTVGRMDNVVAREAERPIRNEDGSYEGFVELVRLSDGMVIGRASALCGTPDDPPWGGMAATQWKAAQPPRSEPARRAMAVTRATSRAFRQQYSWIMALAGYQPTPAEEMPHDEPPTNVTPPTYETGEGGSLIGTAEAGKAPADFELRETPEGSALAFRLVSGRKSMKVIAADALATGLAMVRPDIEGQTVQVWGTIGQETWTPPNSKKSVTFDVLTLSKIVGPAVTLPMDTAKAEEPQAGGLTPPEAPQTPASGAKCGAKGPDSIPGGAICSLDKGHEGKHRELAADNRVLASWL